MSDLSLTILAETANDAQAIERLHERTFGPGRFVLSAYRLREHVDHVLDLFLGRAGLGDNDHNFPGEMTIMSLANGERKKRAPRPRRGILICDGDRSAG